MSVHARDTVGLRDFEERAQKPWVWMAKIHIKDGLVAEFLDRVQQVLDEMRHEKTFLSTSLCEHPTDENTLDRKSVVEGKSGSVRVDLGGRRIIKKNKQR